uniref:Carboxylic ester hydrolase n=1 Tax=Diabrotica virgifera virgifera TaxID=50390 RepID=A0A6P7GR84_DIAVI
MIQYRLGVFGFMSTGDSACPGNLGLKDQVMALDWTIRNIRHFGGNPKDITIGGLSAGGGSVGYHLLSPKSAGKLFSCIVTLTRQMPKPRRWKPFLYNSSSVDNKGKKDKL